MNCCVSQDSVHVASTKSITEPNSDRERYSAVTRKPGKVLSREAIVEVDEVEVSPRGYIQTDHGVKFAAAAEVQDVLLHQHGLQQGPDARCDFNGWWRCVQINGNMRDFLRDMGLSEELLDDASTRNYGIGEQVQHIVQTGNLFEVENFLIDPVRMQFTVGQGEQLTVDRGNRPIIVDPHWDGPVLVIKSRRVTGETIAHSRRYFSGDLMVLEFTSPKGMTVERIFTRKRM